MSAEILETGFFALDFLPGSTSAGAQCRLAELQEPRLTTWDCGEESVDHEGELD